MLPADSGASDEQQRTRRASSSRASIVSSSYFSPPTATTAQEAADTFLLIQHLLLSQQQQQQQPAPPAQQQQQSHNQRILTASAPSSPGLHPLQSSRTSYYQYPQATRARSRAGSSSSSSHSHNLHNLHNNGSQSTLIPSLFPLTPLPSSPSTLPPPPIPPLDDLPPSYTVATQSSSHAGTPPLQRPRSRRTSSSHSTTTPTNNNAPSQRGLPEEVPYAPSGSLPPSRRSSVRAQANSRGQRSRPGSSSGSGPVETPMFTAPNSGRNSNRNSVSLGVGTSEQASRRSSLHISGTQSPAAARHETEAFAGPQQVSTEQDQSNLRQRRWTQSRSSSAQTISQQPRPHLSRSSTAQPIHYTSVDLTTSNQDNYRPTVSSPSRRTTSKMRGRWSFKYLLPHHLLRFLLRILLTPIWLFTSVPHSSQAVVDAQPWGIRVLLFPLRLFAAVPGSIGTFWLLRNTFVGIQNEGFGPWTKPAKVGSGREEHPPAVVFAIASLWSLSTAYYALSLTTMLLRRWLLYYSPLSSIIRLVALQAICWPLVRITLFVFGPHRPLEAWVLIATTTTFSDTVARWLVSNIVDRIDGGLEAWVGEDSDMGWGSRSQSRSADWEGGIHDSTHIQAERRLRRRGRRRRGQVFDGRSEAEDQGVPELSGHTNRDPRERRLRARSSYPDRMLRNDVGAALLAFEVKDTTTDDTESGSDNDLDVELEVYPDGTTRRRRRGASDRRQEQRRGSSSRRHLQERMSASEGFQYEHPRRTASFPRLPTSDLLFDTPSSSSSSTSATPSSVGTASDGEQDQGGRDRRANRRAARQAANQRGSGDGAESGADETPLTLMLPVRRVFHWDVAIKRNILPMGVLAYVSLWALLGHSRVEGRGR